MFRRLVQLQAGPALSERSVRHLSPGARVQPVAVSLDIDTAGRPEGHAERECVRHVVARPVVGLIDEVVGTGVPLQATGLVDVHRPLTAGTGTGRGADDSGHRQRSRPTQRRNLPKLHVILL